MAQRAKGPNEKPVSIGNCSLGVYNHQQMGSNPVSRMNGK
jgi:hypothetical protein